eukprot:symbB.v1.2.009146.t2/scaffold548.1/size229490/6
MSKTTAPKPIAPAGGSAWRHYQSKEVLGVEGSAGLIGIFSRRKSSQGGEIIDPELLDAEAKEAKARKYAGLSWDIPGVPPPDFSVESDESNALCRAQLSVFSKGIKDIATRDPGWRVFLVIWHNEGDYVKIQQDKSFNVELLAPALSGKDKAVGFKWNADMYQWIAKSHTQEIHLDTPDCPAAAGLDDDSDPGATRRKRCAANQERLATKGCYGGIMKLCRSVLLHLLR